MTNRFVDGEPELARKQEKILLAGLDRGSGEMFENLLTDTGRVFAEIGLRNSLPTGRLRLHRVVAGARTTIFKIDRRSAQQRIGAHDVLLDGGTFRRCEVLILGLK